MKAKIKYFNINTKNNNKFINILFLLILLQVYLLNSKIKRNLNTENEIKLIINEIGNQYILNPNFTYKPNKIIINNNEITNLNEDMFYNLSIEEGNEIILIWSEPLISCKEMFYDLSNITEINFTNLIQLK